MASLLLFIIFIPFAFSEELTNGVLDAARSSINRPRWLYAGVDLVILIVIVWLATALRTRGHPKTSLKFSVSCIALGAAGTLAVDLVAAGDSSRDFQNLPQLGIYLLADAAWLLLLAAILSAALGLSPAVIFRRHPQQEWDDIRPLLPLLLGTGAAWVAGQLWDYALAGTPSAGDQSVGLVGAQFFPQLSQVIPLLLVALAVEAKVFRRDPQFLTQRAASVVTVVVLCLGELAVLSALASSRVETSLGGWHEFIAFVFGIEAVLVGLITLILVATDAPLPPAPTAATEPDKGRTLSSIPLTEHETCSRPNRLNSMIAAGIGAVLALAYGLVKRARFVRKGPPHAG